MYNKEIFNRTFHYPKKYWYKNIKNIPRYFKDIHFLMKNGYDRYAVWDTFDWFTVTMKDILTRYKQSHVSSPVVIKDFPYSVEEIKTQNGEEKLKTNSKLWDEILDQLILYLDKMDEMNPIYENMDIKEKNKCMLEAKDDFFELFAEHFYDFWD